VLPSYGIFVRKLDVSTRFAPPSPESPSSAVPQTPRTDALVRLLAAVPRLERLSLHLSGGLAPHVIPAFAHLTELRELEMENCDDEIDVPL